MQGTCWDRRGVRPSRPTAGPSPKSQHGDPPCSQALSPNATLTGGPAAPVAPSFPRAPCEREGKPSYVHRVLASP